MNLTYSDKLPVSKLTASFGNTSAGVCVRFWILACVGMTVLVVGLRLRGNEGFWNTEFHRVWHRVSQGFKCILKCSVQARHDVFLTTKGTKILATHD